jgi:hypothetical protein
MSGLRVGGWGLCISGFIYSHEGFRTVPDFIYLGLFETIRGLIIYSQERFLTFLTIYIYIFIYLHIHIYIYINMVYTYIYIHTQDRVETVPDYK